MNLISLEEELAFIEEVDQEDKEESYRAPSKKKAKTDSSPKSTTDGVKTRTARRQIEAQEAKAFKEEKNPFSLVWKELPNKHLLYLNSPEIKPCRSIYAFDLVSNFGISIFTCLGRNACRTAKGKKFY